MMRRTALVVTLSLALALAAAASALAGADARPALQKVTTRDVCPGLCAYASIQAAINDSLDGDIIRVAGAPGSAYSEHLTIAKSVQILGGYAGPPGWQRDIVAYATVIDGQDNGTVVTISSGSALLEGFTVRRGFTANDGGGILIQNASPVISATTIVSNTATSSGGGVAIFGGAAHFVRSTIFGNAAIGGGGLLIADLATPILSETTIAGNQAYLFGGGLLIVNGAAPEISGCVVQANRAPSGGGLQVFSSPGLLTGSQVTGNTAESGNGGGLSLQSSTMMIVGSAIISNTASSAGGGLHLDASSPLIDDCTVSANQAGDGGGVYAVNSLGVIANTTIAGNQATGVGGGIVLDRSAPALDADSVLANSAGDHGGGIEISGRYCPTEMCENPASSLIANTVIARNSAGSHGSGVRIGAGTAPDLINNTIAGHALEGVYIDAYAQAGVTNTIVISNGVGLRALIPSAPYADYNLVWGNTQGNYAGLPPGAHDLSADARLVGYAAGNYHLRSDSPAIDSGLNSAAPGSDRDGNVRPLVGRCGGQQVADIGAYEYLLAPSDCSSPTPTGTAVSSPTSTPSPSRTATASATIAPVTGTPTPSATASRTATRTLTATPSRTGTATVTVVGTRTPTATATRTRTATATGTATLTATPSTVVHRISLPVIVNAFIPDCALYEPNDSLATAWGPLQMNTPLRAHLCVFDGVDWYFLETRRAGGLAVDLAVPDLAADLNLYVHAADGSIIAMSTTVGEGADEQVYAVLQSGGRFFLRVEPVTRRDANQPYELTISFF